MSTAGNIGEIPGSMARLIGYLSICMLAAAFGSMFGNIWSRYWLIFGTLGLISAVGLNLLSQVRSRSIKLKRTKKGLRQAEKSLNKVVDVEESFHAIGDAVRQIQASITDTNKHREGAEVGARVPLTKSVTIKPIGEAAEDKKESFVGSLRNISSRGFSLSHDCLLERGYVLLGFTFENHEPVQLIADLLWCERQPDGLYHSGGKFLEVVDSAHAGTVI